MTAVQVTLTHPSINGGVAVRVLCDSVRVGGKKNLVSDPNANNDGTQVEVQTQSPENLTYAVRGIRFTNVANTFTYAQLLTLYRHKYDGTTSGANGAVILNVTYGGNDANGKLSGTQNLVGFDGATTNIRVELQDFSFPIDVTQSRNGYIPIADMTLRETS